MSQNYPYPTTRGPNPLVSSLELSRQAAERYTQVSAARAATEARSRLRLPRRRTATRPA